MALNFPNTGLYNGLQYTGDNGVVYIYDGVKWVGHSPTLAPGTSSLVNGSNVVQVDGAGNLVIPDGAQIVYQSGGSVASTATIWTNNANGCLRTELSSTGFQAFTDGSHVDLQDSGIFNIGSYQNNTTISNDGFANPRDLWLRSGSATYISTDLDSSEFGRQWIFGGDGEFTLPSGGRLGYAGKGWTGLDGGLGMPVSLTSLYPSGMYSGCVTIAPGNGVQLSTYGDGTGQTGSWTFTNDGYLQLQQNDARIATSSTVVCPINADTVIYASTNQYQMTLKLLIKVEGFAVADTDPWDTQSTEMIIAKSFNGDKVAASAYGVVHTSIDPLATFTAQWNAITSKVEVLCRPTSSAYPVQVRTFVTEVTSSD